MPQSNLFGTYALTSSNVDEIVKGKGAGAYALGAVNDKGVFMISRIGRSDEDLNKRLKDYIGKYRAFKYAFYPDSKSAFLKECELYHNFNPPDNSIHPDKPKNTNYICPYCSKNKS